MKSKKLCRFFLLFFHPNLIKLQFLFSFLIQYEHTHTHAHALFFSFTSKIGRYVSS